MTDNLFSASARARVLDCTLRDGGYYNSWDFDPDLVSAYLRAARDSGIDAIELGFRFTATDRFLGPYAYGSDATLSALDLPDGPLIGVMCNAKDLLEFDGGPAAAIDALFAEKSDSPVALVRIAAHFAEVPDCGPAMQRLKEKGYATGINLMQATGRDPADITALARTITGWDAIDILYFADSLGNMEAEGARACVAAIRAGWDGPIGTHMHDNMGRALDNTLAAREAGATWLDATILGMGRGAGNARMEYLLLEMQRAGIGTYRPEALVPLATGGFAELQRRYGWGSNPYYYLSAVYGIHPTYVQQMLSDDRYGPEEILGVLETLRDAGGGSFSHESLENALASDYALAEGNWDASGWCAGRDLLIIAAGSGLERHRGGLLSYIEKTKPRVLCLNRNDVVPAGIVDAYAASHPTRILSHADSYRERNRPLIAPMAALPEAIRDQLEGIEVLDYGMQVTAGNFNAAATGCVVPAPLVAAYGLALGRASGAARILLAGFDGYGADDPRQTEMNHVFEAFQGSGDGNPPLLAVTPSTYTINQGSIYAPGC